MTKKPGPAVDFYLAESPHPVIDSVHDSLKKRIFLLLGFVGSIWLVTGSDLLLHLNLVQYGVVPRTTRGLLGIVAEPWLHASYRHLLANTSGLLILGWLTMWPRISGFWLATTGGMLGSGAGAWILGSSHSLHIGASGVIFGYAGYLLARGWYKRDLLGITLAIVVVSGYGASMAAGLLPLVPGVSWQSHLGGALGGIWMAWIAARYGSADAGQAAEPRP